MALKILEEYASYSYYDEDDICVAEYESMPNGFVVANENNEVIRSFDNRADAESYIKQWESLKKGE